MSVWRKHFQCFVWLISVSVLLQFPNRTLLFAACAACIGGTFQYGYNISVINAPTTVMITWLSVNQVFMMIIPALFKESGQGVLETVPGVSNKGEIICLIFFKKWHCDKMYGSFSHRPHIFCKKTKQKKNTKKLFLDEGPCSRLLSNEGLWSNLTPSRQLRVFDLKNWGNHSLVFKWCSFTQYHWILFMHVMDFG